MTDTSKSPEHDPADWTPMIERAFFARLEDQAPADGRPVAALVRERLTALEAEIGHLVANPMDAANARFTVLAVAAYDVLTPVCGPARAAAIVADCLNGPLRADILAGTREMLDHTGDPFATLVAASKQREESYFGPSFHFERPVDDQHTYVLDVRRCLFHEVLAATGRTALQSILCRFDLNWADAIDPERHRLRFVRPVTFAGGPTCRMLFTRQEPG
ncbi:L-2-amino-thiazoline-4-carboxylic acid hydrolase [Actinoplanes utahensis]|uniref:L-2-amino-thiazoline-4-carboxylic acid hydrolase n=1 Tax=Actinoplanes utahensis TaxID=1869 RepID=UPI00068D721D|nr:L-2-amino-thiazoline-4-carboxylic acid hydrolase [Actinoplanes utahensis]GIF27069.1 hypothetical protein Aut01nite_00550 [Actinoplanes utahensis]